MGVGMGLRVTVVLVISVYVTGVVGTLGVLS